MPEEALGYRALIAFHRKAEAGTGTGTVVGKWDYGQGALAAQASCEDCNGHPERLSFWK